MADVIAVAAITGAATVLSGSAAAAVGIYTAKKQGEAQIREREAELNKIRLERDYARQDQGEQFNEYRRRRYREFLTAVDRMVQASQPRPKPTEREAYYRALLASSKLTSVRIEELWNCVTDPGADADGSDLSKRRWDLIAGMREDLGATD